MKWWLLGTGLFLVLRKGGSRWAPVVIDAYSLGLLRRHPTKRYPRRTLPIQALIIHHAGNNGTLESHVDYHIDRHGWAALGYSDYIKKNGELWICNPKELETIHAGNRHYNDVGHGICLAGNLEVSLPTSEQLRTLDWRVANLRKKLGWKVPVKGHKDVRNHPTTCPGKHLYQYMQKYQ